MGNRNSAVNMPNGLTRPLFVYGVFKPNQVGFELIREYIDTITPATVERTLKQRNGIPMLVNDYSERETQGFIYTFDISNGTGKDSDAYKVYKLISNSRKGSLFEWDTITINNNKCNVLVGKDSNLAENYDIPFKNNYDGSTEICFTEEDIEYVKRLIDELNPEDASNKSIFEHEMVYMLIWSFIDKFLSLAYGGHNQSQHITMLSQREDFREALNRTPIKYGRVAHDTRTNNYSKLDLFNPKNSIWYYYLLRCNITHGGKHNSPNVRKQLHSLKQSSSELIEIIGYLFDFNFGRRLLHDDDF